MSALDTTIADLFDREDFQRYYRNLKERNLMRAYIDASMESHTAAKPIDCTVENCLLCSVLVCPHRDKDHFHGNGCSSCGSTFVLKWKHFPE